MWTPPLPAHRSAVLGALMVATTSVALAVVAGWSGDLNRDEAVYAYGGQRVADGTAPYVSIFDPKGPVAFLVAGLGSLAARAVGVTDLLGIRLAFAACAVATALAVYLVARYLWRSTLVAVVAGCAFGTYAGWVRDMLSGPDAKAPAVLFIAAMFYFGVRRRWGWAAAAGALAFATWQPLVLAVLAVLVLGVVASPSGGAGAPSP